MSEPVQGRGTPPYTRPQIADGSMPHFVPFVTGQHLLIRAMKSAESHAHRIILIDNRDNFGNEPRPQSYLPFDVECWKPQTALNHSQMMTWLAFECRRLGYPFFTWMHHDCEVVEDSLSKLLQTAYIARDTGERWGVLLTRDPSRVAADGAWNHVDVMSAINIEAVFDVKGWDWVRFPDYYSDYDFYGRLRKAGWSVRQTGFNIVHQNGGSTTVKADQNRAEVNKATWAARGALWELRRRELGLEWPPPT